MTDDDHASVTSDMQIMLKVTHTLQSFFLTIAESATGYRAQLAAQGFSETAAEQMTVQFHHALTQIVVNAILSQKSVEKSGRRK